ncbi:MAG TPA: hypothetical protein VF553_23050 [Pyrinomonadaceae bacterium]|jgi:hypothetical protein
MPKQASSPQASGLKQSTSRAGAPAPSVELFGHVTLVEGYALPNFQGCHALVALRDTPNKTVAVLTSQHSLQTLLESALSTGNLIAFRGFKTSTPPTPLGGTWIVDVYLIDCIILYSMK